MSWAGYTPTTALIEPERRTPAWDAQFRTAAEISYRQLQLLTGPRYGVYWIDSYNATDDPEASPPGPDSDLVPEALRTGRDREVFGPGEHPFPTKYAVRQSNLAIEPSIYMAALLEDFVLAGGRIVIRRFESPRELASIPEPVIVNCTGLGSFSLFGDKELVPNQGPADVRRAAGRGELPRLLPPARRHQREHQPAQRRHRRRAIRRRWATGRWR